MLTVPVAGATVPSEGLAMAVCLRCVGDDVDSS